MDRKYKLLEDDYINYRGKTLYRIKALRDFGDVLEGDVGGYIENKSNLSQRGNCWVFDNAKAYGNAKILGNAEVLDNSEIFDNAVVFGNAKVYDNSKIYGRASINDNAIASGKSKIFGYAHVYNNAKVCGNATVWEDAQVYNNAKICGNTEVCGNVLIHGNAKILGNAKVCEDAEVHGYAKILGNAIINKGTIIGEVSIPYKNIFQHQCKKRVLTAILTEDNKILYSIGCQENITEEEFIYRIHNKDGGLEKNPYREEYLRLIPLINIYFKGE